MAALGDYMGGLFGGLGNSFNQQQAMFNAQNQTWNASGTANNTYVVTAVPVEAVPAKSPHDETALEWLDRRVDEVCLAL